LPAIVDTEVCRADRLADSLRTRSEIVDRTKIRCHVTQIEPKLGCGFVRFRLPHGSRPTIVFVGFI
jgi:hypothetical protein